MTARQARRERREADRKAKKLEWKETRSADAIPQPPPQPSTASAQPQTKSTGPRSADGKLASSRNSFKHGLASGQIIVPGEDPAAFEALLDDLFAEHQPATTSEALLIQEMAQSHWLAQRALRLQNDCFTPAGVNEKQLALYLRYGTTHQRAFYKALSSLRSLQKDRLRTAAGGFVSQPDPKTSPLPHFVSQELVSQQFVSQSQPYAEPQPAPETLKQAA